MEKTCFVHRIRHYLKDNVPTWDKGIEVHETDESALQSFHAYLGAYAYGHSAETDYVSCAVTNIDGTYIIQPATWKAAVQPVAE